MKIFWLLTFTTFLVSCSNSMKGAQKASGDLVDDVGCKITRSNLFDVLLAGYDETAQILTPKEVDQLISEKLTSKWQSQLSPSQILSLKNSILNFYETVSFVLAKEKKSEVIKESLAAFEVGTVDGIQYGEFSDLVQKKANEVSKLAETFDIPCDDDDDTTPPDTNDLNYVSYGSFYALSVAYQSCDVLDKIPLSDKELNLKGIRITGTHEDGRGQKREISSLPEVQKTHYYLQNINYQKDCLQISKTPLIYDYGGKPYTTSSAPKLLDFFKDAGSGTKVLGMDCSGFVFSALAAGGAKIYANSEMKASLVNGLPARAYMDPVRNKMDCLEHPKFGFTSGTLQEGDIVATEGHIFIIDQIGKDPFGFLSFKDSSQCSTISYKNFDFIIAQSAPIKGGIGISRSFSQDYLQANSTFRVGLENYAKQNCVSYFKKTDGIISNNSSMKIIRHKDIPSCRSQALNLKNEACVQSCFPTHL